MSEAEKRIFYAIIFGGKSIKFSAQFTSLFHHFFPPRGGLLNLLERNGEREREGASKYDIDTKSDFSIPLEKLIFNFSHIVHKKSSEL